MYFFHSKLYGWGFYCKLNIFGILGFATFQWSSHLPVKLAGNKKIMNSKVINGLKKVDNLAAVGLFVYSILISQEFIF